MATHQWLAKGVLPDARRLFAELERHPRVRRWIDAVPDVSGRVAEATRAIRIAAAVAAAGALLTYLTFLVSHWPMQTRWFGVTGTISGGLGVVLCTLERWRRVRSPPVGELELVVEREDESGLEHILLYFWITHRYLVRLESSDGRRRVRELPKALWDHAPVGSFLVVHTHVGSVVGVRAAAVLDDGPGASGAIAARIVPDRTLTAASARSLLPE